MILAKRRKKKSQTESLLAGIVLLSLLGGYKLFGNMTGAAVACGVFLGIVMVVQILIQKQKNDRLRRSGIQDIDKMEGRQFEHYLEQLFLSQGYKTKVTPAAKDFGADLILMKDNRKIIVQAKRYKSPIGIAAIQEAHSAVPYYGGTEAWVVSNQEFTKAARELAATNKVELIGRAALIEMLLKLNPNGANVDAKEIIATVPYTPRICRKCGQSMKIRKSARGEFWGCSSYPRCRHIEPMVK